VREQQLFLVDDERNADDEQHTGDHDADDDHTDDAEAQVQTGLLSRVLPGPPTGTPPTGTIAVSQNRARVTRRWVSVIPSPRSSAARPRS
jgi:hypothetical protein